MALFSSARGRTVLVSTAAAALLSLTLTSFGGAAAAFGLDSSSTGDAKADTVLSSAGGAPVVGHDAVLTGVPGASKVLTTAYTAPAAVGAGQTAGADIVLSPTSITNSAYTLEGVRIDVTGLPADASVVVTDRSPSGETYDFGPLGRTDAEGQLHTTLRIIGPFAEVGTHLVRVTTSAGGEVSGTVEVTADPTMALTGTASPDRLTADQGHDAPITITASGFDANEWVTAHIRTPDGWMSQTGGNMQADASGNFTYQVQMASAAATPGEWSLAIYGEDTGKRAWASWFLEKSPNNAQVGTVQTTTAAITTSQLGREGMGWKATGLPAFGLFDAVLRQPSGFDTELGRFRANGDGVLSDAIRGENALEGGYRLQLLNVNTADWTDTTFTVTADDGSVPPAPTMTVQPTSLTPQEAVQKGWSITADGFTAGDPVQLTIVDEYRRSIDQGTSLFSTTADAEGRVAFQVTAGSAPAPGTWEVAVASPSYAGIIQRTLVTITSSDGGTPTPPDESTPTDPGTTPTSPSSPDPAPTAPETTDTAVILPPALAGEQSKAYFVQLAGPSGLDVKANNPRARGMGGALGAAERQTDSIREDADTVTEEARSLNDESAELYQSVWTVPGVALQTDPATAQKLLENDKVVSVTPIIPKSITAAPASAGDAPNNAASDDLTGVTKTWASAGGFTGTGETIAVIDTGVDYTHATFGGIGGDGSVWNEAGRDYPSEMPPLSTGWWNDTIIAQGWDFAGENYDADRFPIPRPDSNPIDGPGGGHGTHVAGTAAGRGVNADGSTFTGDYRTLTSAELAAMKVAPGSAPGARILPLKVFGDFGGTTALTGAALDWIGGAIAHGTKIDVLNASLGSAYSSVDDPENAMVDALAKLDVVPVISAGNDGDVTDVAGSPGNADSSLAVAASASGFSAKDAAEVYAPTALQGRVLGQYSEEFSDAFDLTGPVAVPTGDPTGCTAFGDTDTALLEGKIAWLDWTGTPTCNSATRFDNAANAGAVAVVLTSASNNFEAQIAGNAAVPGIQLTLDAVTTLQSAAAAGDLVLHLTSTLKQVAPSIDPALRDTIASFSSRGVHGSINDVIKPDVSAPGVNVLSAGRGTGTGSAIMSGTSMASPHTAGVAALARQAHPAWNAERIKELLMNTAAHTITDTSGVPVSPLRQGTGRIDALNATQSQVTVGSVENGGLVSASFGVVEVGTVGAQQTRTLELRNDADTDRAFTVDYVERTTTPGATLTVSPSTVTVPAGGTAQVTVTLTVPDAGALRRTLDAGAAHLQTTSNHIADISGTVRFQSTASDQPPLWVTAYAAPKPVATLTPNPLTFPDPQDVTEPLTFAGVGLRQGEGDQAYTSRVAAFELGTTSPRLNLDGQKAQDSLRGTDISAIGANSTAPSAPSPEQGILTIGAAMYAPLVNTGSISFPMAQIDADRDGRPDFVTTVTRDASDGGTLTRTFDLGTGTQLDTQPLNGLDTLPAQWDNDTTILPVALSTMGFSATSPSQIGYRVITQSRYGAGDGTVDRTPWIGFDVYHPTITTTTAGPIDPSTLALNRQATATSGSLLVLAPDNASGTRASIVGWAVGDAAAPPTTPVPSDGDPGTEPAAPEGSPSAGGHLAVTGSEPLLGLIVIGVILLGVGIVAVRSRRARIQADATPLTNEADV